MKNDNDETEHAKKSLKTTRREMADVLVEEFLGLWPGGAFPYRLAKTSLRARAKRRLDEFHKRILHGVPDEDKEKLKRNFTLDDYHSFLNYTINDEEERKVILYGRIFQGFLLRDIPPETKVHLLKASRELTFGQFELMRSLYIASKYEFMRSQGRQSQIDAITRTRDPLDAAGIQTFFRLGFLSQGEKSLEPTKMLTLLIELAYDSDDLTPESLGRQRQTVASRKFTVWFLCNDLTKAYVLLLSKLSDALVTQNIMSETLDPVIAKRLSPAEKMLFGPEILVLVIGAKGSPIESVKKHLVLENKSIIQVLLPGGKFPMVPFTAAPIFDFSNGIDPEGLGRFTSTVKTEVEKRGLLRPVKPYQ